MSNRINTTDPRLIRQRWIEIGGTVEPVRRTGELRWRHPALPKSVRANGRRHDIPAVILCLLNKLIQTGGHQTMRS